MLLGYCFGKLFRSEVNPSWRKKVLLQMGAGLIFLFILLRIINEYGDPIPWSEHQRGDIFSFLSFININKYPPSLDFLCVTIGGGMLMLALLEGVRNKITDIFRVYGRVPMFYYILHFYLIHLLVVIGFLCAGISHQPDRNAQFSFPVSAKRIWLWSWDGVFDMVICGSCFIPGLQKV